jgi:hypothetical protein
MGMYMVCSDLFRMICVLLLLAVCGIATRSDHRTIAGTGCLVSRKVESIGIGRTPIVVVLGYYRSYTIILSLPNAGILEKDIPYVFTHQGTNIALLVKNSIVSIEREVRENDRHNNDSYIDTMRTNPIQ